jgi:hypothetical protein
MTRVERVEFIRPKYRALAPLLNERTRRCWAATEAQALGYGGISIVAEALGVARGTIHAGLSGPSQKFLNIFIKPVQLLPRVGLRECPVDRHLVVIPALRPGKDLVA